MTAPAADVKSLFGKALELAEEILRGGYKPNDTVRVDVGEEGFAFTKVS